MPSRFFRRAIGWNDYRAHIDLVAPIGVDAPEPQYNIAPTQIVPILRRAPEGEYAPQHDIQIAPAFWGLVPSWWSHPLSEKNFSTFNARAETIETSRVFSGAFRQTRCLVPASGFYAWSGAGTAASTPFAIGPADGGWFCFAGLWSRWMYDGSEIDTFAVVTVEPNALVAGFTSSMPAILAPKDYARWLDLHYDADPGALLKPCPADALRAWPAHPSVGNVRNQSADVLGDQAL